MVKFSLYPWLCLVMGTYQHPRPHLLVFSGLSCIHISNRIFNKSLLLSSHCKLCSIGCNTQCSPGMKRKISDQAPLNFFTKHSVFVSGLIKSCIIKTHTLVLHAITHACKTTCSACFSPLSNSVCRHKGM